MAYSKTTWSDDVTPVNASNLNKIEDALVDQDSRIDANTDLIGGLWTCNALGTIDDFEAYCKSLPEYTAAPFYTGSDIASDLTNGNSSKIGLRGLVFRSSSNYSFDMLYFGGTSITTLTAYIGRYNTNNHSFTMIRKITSEAL